LLNYGHPSFVFVCFFFFQAEDGIRDPLVTGVQTCALPISEETGNRSPPSRTSPGNTPILRSSRSAMGPCTSLTRGNDNESSMSRSEERRVGKECRSRWSPNQYKRKNKNA